MLGQKQTHPADSNWHLSWLSRDCGEGHKAEDQGEQCTPGKDHGVLQATSLTGCIEAQGKQAKAGNGPG